MVKHFEELWEESERLSANNKIQNIQEQLHFEIDRLLIEEISFEDRSKSFGIILYLLCYLSFRWNINTFAALLKEVQDRKIDLMEGIE